MRLRRTFPARNGKPLPSICPLRVSFRASRVWAMRSSFLQRSCPNTFKKFAPKVSLITKFGQRASAISILRSFIWNPFQIAIYALLAMICSRKLSAEPPWNAPVTITARRSPARWRWYRRMVMMFRPVRSCLFRFISMDCQSKPLPSVARLSWAGSTVLTA